MSAQTSSVVWQDLAIETYQLSIVQGHNHTQTTNTKASHESTAQDIADSFGVRLDYDTHTEDNNGENSCVTATDRVGKPSV